MLTVFFYTDWNTVQWTNRLPMLLKILIKITCALNGLIHEPLGQTASELVRDDGALAKGGGYCNGCQFTVADSVTEGGGIVILGYFEVFLGEETTFSRDLSDVLGWFVDYVSREAQFLGYFVVELLNNYTVSELLVLRCSFGDRQ